LYAVGSISESLNNVGKNRKITLRSQMELEYRRFDIHTENGCRLINIGFLRYPSEFFSAEFLGKMC
jgi:hypothetical protein